MKKVITIALLGICAVALAQTRYYPMQYDQNGNIRGKNTLLTQNGIAEKTEVEAVSNRFNSVIFGGAGSSSNATVVGLSSEGFSDSGIDLDVIVWGAGYTNVQSILNSVGEPNGIAQLDENGKIDAALIEEITVVFTGNHTSTNSP